MNDSASTLARWVDRLRPVVPWLSLVAGIAGAFVMERGPREGRLVAGATLAAWVMLVVLHRLSRAEPPSSERATPSLPPLVVRAARLGSLFATQSRVQLALFFAVPFYVQAASWDVGHAVFLLLLGALCIVSLWDPWSEWVLVRPGLGALLPALATFLALDAVLPGLGISTQLSLWTSSCVAAASATFAVALAERPERRKRAALIAFVVAGTLPGSLFIGGARIVPAAPLRLVRAEIGIERSGKWIREPVDALDHVPPRLICASAIYSPTGLHDRLFHVWRKNGDARARVALAIVGGRRGGYRTQSNIRHFGKDPRGVYECTVETATGQVLGSRRVTIRGIADYNDRPASRTGKERHEDRHRLQPGQQERDQPVRRSQP